MCDVCGCESVGKNHTHHGSHAHIHSEQTFPAQHVEVERDLLAKNDSFASENRRLLRARDVQTYNLLSSPGSGKTTLLVETIRRLAAHQDAPAVAVIEGDQQTSRDADKIRTTGVPVVQVNTGRGCHLDAHQVGHALEALPLKKGLLFIENVGNLVCPAMFDLGETRKVVLLSVTEGEDKPLKYPTAFVSSDVLVLTKLDLAEPARFDRRACLAFAREVNPTLRVFELSAITGQGMDEWVDWLVAEGASVHGALHTRIEGVHDALDLDGVCGVGEMDAD